MSFWAHLDVLRGVLIRCVIAWGITTIGTFLTLSLIMGVLFELPLLAWILASLGILEASLLRQYRKHAVVLIVILAAVITPTGDAFTLLLVSVPIYLLYELSIGIVERVNKKTASPTD